MPRLKVLLIQLPVPRAAALAPTGNVAMAIGDLAVSVAAHGLSSAVEVELLPAAVADAYGDRLLADLIARREPDLLGMSLYLWNVERSLHVAALVKERSPRTRVVVGGPEVCADNPLVTGANHVDWAIAGEAEATFAAFLVALRDGQDPGGLPAVATAVGRGLGEFVSAPAPSFALSAYRSPYVAGVLPVDARRSVYVESMRGCKAHCSFCFYPRASPKLRALPVDETVALLRELKERGARDVAFLDPTFNQRPDFETLLDALVDLNCDHALSFFAEMRAEGVTRHQVQKLAAAGFSRIEIGLQSVSKTTRALVRCGGNPECIATVGRMLQDVGINAVVDLILGLPGDSGSDVLNGVDFLKEHALSDSGQVFLLSVLPGTALRADAKRLGLSFDPLPPYRVIRTATLSEEALADVWGDAEALLERPLDESLRPLLVEDSAPGEPRDVIRVDLDGLSSSNEVLAAPGAAHAAIWITGRDLWARRSATLEILRCHRDRDPCDVVDLVLRPRGPFPLDLLESLANERAAWRQNGFAARRQGPGGENGQLRISVSLPENHGFGTEYVEALRQRVAVYEDQTLKVAVAHAAELGVDRPAARVVGKSEPTDPRLWRELAADADPEAVVFAERASERRWVQEVLGLGELERR